MRQCVCSQRHEAVRRFTCPAVFAWGAHTRGKPSNRSETPPCASQIINPIGAPTEVRFGIHTGSIASGVIGTKSPRFCLFGDTMNVTSRMESTGEPGHLHVSKAFADLLPQVQWTERCALSDDALIGYVGFPSRPASAGHVDLTMQTRPRSNAPPTPFPPRLPSCIRASKRQCRVAGASRRRDRSKTTGRLPALPRRHMAMSTDSRGVGGSSLRTKCTLTAPNQRAPEKPLWHQSGPRSEVYNTLSRRRTACASSPPVRRL